MSKPKFLIVILFISILFLLINLNIKYQNNKQTIVNNDQIFKSEYNDTMIYNLEGILNYRIISQHIDYLPKYGISWFTQPIFIYYDRNKTPVWLIKSDNTKLTRDHMLYMYGHVEICALTDNAQLQKITTNNAQINLLTKDIISHELVKLYGASFHSSGLKMRGNLLSKNAELIEEVKTFYEIQNKKKYS